MNPGEEVYEPAAARQADLLDQKQAGPAEAAPERGTRPRSGIGICCSGGGIRSASYNLGTLQALNEAGILGRADYLAAVSGGSYITSAFAMAARHSDPGLLGGSTSELFKPGSPEEEFVRNRSSYLAEGVKGKARLFGSVLMGFACNIVFLFVMLYAVARPLGWLLAWWEPSFRLPDDCGERGVRGCFRHANWSDGPGWLKAVLIIAAAGLLLALVARMFHPLYPVRHTLEVAGLVFVLGAATLGFVFVLLPELVVLARNYVNGGAPEVRVDALSDSTSARTSATVGAATTVGYVVVASASLAQLALHLRRAFAVGHTVAKAAGRFSKLGAGLRKATLYFVGAIVGPLTIFGSIVLIMNAAAVRRSPTGGEVAVWAGIAVAFGVIWRFADVTSWSMHPFYKRRLASAFAVKRVEENGKVVAREIDFRHPLPMDGFAPSNMQVPFPEMLVCAAANVSDPGLTPPGVRVTSWVFSPTEIGGPLVGGMRMADYCRAVGKRRSLDITMSAAVAMSGAAIAPSMGKMTIAPLRFLMAFANVRLGVWMPNPGRLPKSRVAPANPRPLRLLYEVLGRNSLKSRYIYVTDGGHYENLGLVELIRRKCTEIYCFDAAGGEVDTYSTLGEAMALARSELQVDIDLDPTVIRPKGPDGLVPVNYAVGTITYPDKTKGRIVYVKAAPTSETPWDVRAYGEKDPTFPSTSTADQLYTGQRFEAYRMLGYRSAQLAIEASRPAAVRGARKSRAAR